MKQKGLINGRPSTSHSSPWNLCHRPMLLVAVASILLHGKAVSTSLDMPPTLCQVACKKDLNGTAVYNFCQTNPGMTISGRCCLNVTDSGTSVVGIDLQECDMKVSTFSNGIVNMSSLQYISLEGNNNMGNLQDTDFHRNTEIAYLSLPLDLHCPGTNGTWLLESSDANATVCRDEQDACLVHNVTCPANSHCVHSGVDLTECLCDEGFHGYKCLEQGVFPVTSFLVGIIIPTVVLCVLVYVTQHRHVVEQQARKVT